MNALSWSPPSRFIEEREDDVEEENDGGGGDSVKEYVAFTDDELEESEYSREVRHEYNSRECPLCDVQEAGDTAANTHVAQIMSLESGSFGRVPDLRTFTEIADLYNTEVVAPNAVSGRTVRPWTKVGVKHHFDKCKIVPRRRAAQLLKRAGNIMDLTYKKCKQRNVKTGEVFVDHRHAGSYFNQAAKYMQFLRDYRLLTGTDANGISESASRPGVKRTAVMDTSTGSVQNGLLYHFSEGRLSG